jgi:hypothetical protein
MFQPTVAPKPAWVWCTCLRLKARESELELLPEESVSTGFPVGATAMPSVQVRCLV